MSTEYYIYFYTSKFHIYSVVIMLFPNSSYHRGGRILTVTGTEFLSVEQPKMFAYVPTLSGEYYPTNTTVSLYVEADVIFLPKTHTLWLKKMGLCWLEMQTYTHVYADRHHSCAKKDSSVTCVELCINL